MSTRVTWRYLVLAVGFLALAGVRAAQGATVWAVVFAVAAAADLWLALRDGQGQAAPGAPADADPREVAGERAHCLAALRRWQVLALVGALLAAGLLLVEPPLAVLAAAAVLFAVLRARRVRRYAAMLPAPPPPAVPRAVTSPEVAGSR
ncbi:hypothetical protein Acsp06_44580 [Actinomycetospora sp. NBRC 106375]|uniref:hypothetical protein n=1 Tax=Actinomycetospora sp. NBRC 106375 TaxID=3032207 RepID=UPI0024A3E165|nr:hypothetical protein [Actinomycetospora sp. NBRC 106375]GLZ48273.1 hypothetical protein Acsp06_44580 [Actinomycetospora sp. NBRC 106375]